MKYKAAICAIVKDEGRYIREWIAYHHAIGFEQFYIFDNESTDDTQDALKLASAYGICRVSNWPNHPGKRTQLEAYKAGLSLAKNEAEWLLFLDADEFLTLKKHRTISAFLEEFDDVSAVGINWKMFGSSGAREYTPGLLMERFTHAAPDEFGPNHLIKTIARTDHLVQPYVHTHHLTDDAQFVNPSRISLKHFPSARQDITCHEKAQINHYFTKSYDEWTLKRNRGKVEFSPDHPDWIRSDAEFRHYDRNETKEDTILLWREATIRNILRIFNHI